MVRRRIVASREAAQEAIRAGLVTVDGAPASKPASQVLPEQALAVVAPPRRFVSRGGEKLDHGLAVFDVDPSGRRCLDAGVSTGGFTDCLLQRGADEVVAVDVGYGQVHDRVRTDARVDVRERTNVRDLTLADLGGDPVDLVVCDVSFIALKTILPTLRALAAGHAEAVVLAKPQFEAQKADVGKGGVVRDPAVWSRVLAEVGAAAAEVGWPGFDVTPSPLLGPAGNVEFLVHLTTRSAERSPSEAIARAVAAGQRLRDGEEVAP